MERIWLALAALLGAILVGLAGKWDAHEPFDGRKFGATVIRALVPAVAWAIVYSMKTLDVGTLMFAFLTGTGFDVAVNRIAGALGNPQFPLPAVPPAATTPTSPPGITPSQRKQGDRHAT